jgi:hypothetical protein
LVKVSKYRDHFSVLLCGVVFLLPNELVEEGAVYGPLVSSCKQPAAEKRFAFTVSYFPGTSSVQIAAPAIERYASSNSFNASRLLIALQKILMDISTRSVFILDGIHNSWRKLIIVRTVPLLREAHSDDPGSLTRSKVHRCALLDPNDVIERESVHRLTHSRIGK